MCEVLWTESQLIVFVAEAKTDLITLSRCFNGFVLLRLYDPDHRNLKLLRPFLSAWTLCMPNKVTQYKTKPFSVLPVIKNIPAASGKVKCG